MSLIRVRSDAHLVLRVKEPKGPGRPVQSVRVRVSAVQRVGKESSRKKKRRLLAPLLSHESKRAAERSPLFTARSLMRQNIAWSFRGSRCASRQAFGLTRLRNANTASVRLRPAPLVEFSFAVPPRISSFGGASTARLWPQPDAGLITRRGFGWKFRKCGNCACSIQNLLHRVYAALA